MNNLSHGRSKFLSNYGGVGSLIDTVNCTVMIETFNNWGYPKGEKMASFIIQDDRLLKRLRYRFSKLRHLVSVPTEDQTPYWQDKVQPQANHFPKWFYCPKCQRLRTYKEWSDKWKEVDTKFDFNLQCYHDACNREKLEQVRFILTCKNGHIRDLPWEFWKS